MKTSTMQLDCFGYDGLHEDDPILIEIAPDAWAPSMTWVKRPNGEALAVVSVDYYNGEVGFLIHDRRNMENEDGHIFVRFDKDGYATRVEVNEYYDAEVAEYFSSSINVPKREPADPVKVVPDA